MGLNSLKLYYNTGFDDPQDIPGNPSLLESAFSRDLPGHWSYSDFNLGSIRVECTADIIKNAEYCKYGNYYYKILERTPLNENCWVLSIELDALTTMGGPAHLNYDGGIIKRAHAISDTLFSNICEEPIGCSEELEIVGQTSTEDDNDTTTYRSLVLSTTDLSADLTKCKSVSFYDEDDHVVVSIPKSPPASDDTAIEYINPAGETKTITIPGTNFGVGYYDLSSDGIKNNIQILRSYGLETSALYAYAIDNKFFQQTGGAFDGKITKLTSRKYETPADAYNSNYSGIHNNKTYSMYNSYVMKSNTSGDMLEIKASDLGVTSDSPSPVFVETADPQYNGRPYLTPKKYKSFTMKDPTYMSVAGLPWLDIPIAYNEVSGGKFKEIQYKTNVGGIKVNALKNPYTGLTYNARGAINTGKEILGTQNSITNSLGWDVQGYNNSIGGKTNLFNNGSGFNTMSGLTKLDYKLAAEKIDYESQTVVAPELSTQPVFGLQRCIKNEFTIYHIAPSAKDIAAIDKYFTMYGYAQPNIVFDKAYLNGRQYFNYIECSGVKITRDSASDPYGIDIKLKAQEQLNNGVRIWHVLPRSMSSITSNPIV